MNRKMEHIKFPGGSDCLAAELTPPHCVAMQSFGEILGELISRSDLTSIRAFAEHFKLSHTQVRRVLAGTYGPNPDWLDDWASYFNLQGPELERFYALAQSARAKGKKDSADYIDRLEKKIEQYEEEDKLMYHAMEDIVISLTQRGFKVPQSFKKMMAILKQRIRTTI